MEIAMENNSNRVYIITGVFGHLGNTLAGMLLKRGGRVLGLALPDERELPLSGDFTLFRGNVCDKESLRLLFEVAKGKEIIVIHTAGIVTIASKFDAKVHEVNVNGTKNMLFMAKKYNVKKMVHVSSVHAIPTLSQEQTIREIVTFNPDAVTGLYAKTKAEATAAVLKAADEGLPICVVHPSGIIGPNDYGHGHITQLVIDYLKGRLTACVKGGYDFVDVRDVANGILDCAKSGKNGECYILSNRFIPLSELFEQLHFISGRKRLKTVLPLWFARVTAPLAETYYKIRKQPPLYTAYSLYTLQCNANFSHQKATEEFGYKTRPLADTLRDTVAFLKKAGRV